MSKKNQKETVNVGLDIGYGGVKGICGDTKITFPSVAGRAVNVRFGGDDIGNNYPNEEIEHNGSMWVGTLASEHLRAEQQRRLRGRSANSDEVGMDFRVLMMKAALAKMFPGKRNGDAVHINLVTGLPVNHMPQAKDLKFHLIGQHLIHTNDTHFTANVIEAAVMPEPRGTMYAFTLRPDGELDEYYNADTTVVFNGGAVTNDVQYDRNGRFVDAYSASSRTGYHLAYEYLQNVIEERYGETPPLHILDMIIRSKAFRVAGEIVTMREEVEEALRPVREGALQLLADTIQTGMTVDKVIVSGGFTLTSFDCIANKYKQAVKSDNPLFDTAQGYQNYAMMKWQ